MNFVETGLAGAYVVDIAPREDERGFFARTFCADEFAAAGLHTTFPQCNISVNRKKGTLRGMHFQAAPHAEPKLVRCARGAIFDVIIDLRVGSPTRTCWFGVELTSANARALYVPEGFAHGFQTFVDDTEVLYYMGAKYHPASALGVRWNDPEFAIKWPLAAPILSERDANYPGFAK